MAIKVTYPNSREVIDTGSPVLITWTSTTSGTARVSIWAGSRWIDSLADVPATQGSFAWTVPLDFPVGVLYRIRVEMLPTAAVRDYSDGYFTIRQPVAAPPPDTGLVTTLPPGLPVNYTFYKKYLNSNCGFIVSSASVSDEALLESRRKVESWLVGRNDLTAKLRSFKHRFLIIGKNEQLLDLPEYKNWDRDFPIPGGWNARSRGQGGQPGQPYTSFGEENVLGIAGDRYKGEDIVLHEFGHSIHLLAANFVISSFDARLKAAYLAATTRDGLWLNTYAGSNHYEYWAEGVQTWFDRNMYVATPNGVHNTINTRVELYNYDRNLYNLLDEVFTV